jgi:hypothetical protein
LKCPRNVVLPIGIHVRSDVLRLLSVLHPFLAFDHRRRHCPSVCHKSRATRVLSTMKAAQGAKLRVPPNEHWQVMLLCRGRRRPGILWADEIVPFIVRPVIRCFKYYRVILPNLAGGAECEFRHGWLSDHTCVAEVSGSSSAGGLDISSRGAPSKN